MHRLVVDRALVGVGRGKQFGLAGIQLDEGPQHADYRIGLMTRLGPQVNLFVVEGPNAASAAAVSTSIPIRPVAAVASIIAVMNADSC